MREPVPIIQLGASDFIDLTCRMLSVSQVPNPDSYSFVHIKKRTEGNYMVIDATYNGVGGNEARWRYTCDGILVAFYVYKTKIQKKIDAIDGRFCNWSEAYIANFPA